MDNRVQGQQYEIAARIEELTSLSPDEFNKVGALEVQTFLRDILTYLRHAEMNAEELQRTREQIEEARREYLDLYEFAPVGYFNLDTRGAIVKVNTMASDMLNIPKERLISRPFSEFVQEHHHRKFAAFLNDLARTLSRMSTEVEMRRGEGRVFYAQLQAVPLNEKTSIVYRMSVADITDRKKVEEALREREERLSNLFQSMDEGFALCEMIYDQKGKPVDFRYLEVNPAFARQTGFPVEQVVGHTVKELIPNIEPFWIETYDRVVKSGRSERIDNPVAELKKYYVVHAWRSAPGRFAVVFHDITELKRVKSKTKT